MNIKVRSALIALLTAVIWGLAFIAQVSNRLGTLTFNTFRCLPAFLFLFLLALLKEKGKIGNVFREETKEKTKQLWVGGILCGVTLAIAMFLQQHGIDMGVEAGKSGFITSLYMIMLPIGLGLFNRKVHWTVWIGIMISLVGLYFICIAGKSEASPADLFLLLGAVAYTLQMIAVDQFCSGISSLKMSCIQFLTAFLLSLPMAMIFEEIDFSAILKNAMPILYLGIFSSGIAFTLQIEAQKGGDSPVVALIMSTESVFGAIFGALILKERMTPREFLGCCIVFAAVLFTEFAPVVIEKLKKPGKRLPE